MLSLDHAIKGRRSIRRFKPDEIPVDTVRAVLEAGTWAPSAKNGQQWRFTVLTGESKKRFTAMFGSELTKLMKKKQSVGPGFGSLKVMEQAPVNIIVWNINEKGWITEVHSVAAAIQNMLLKAYSLGLGSLWIGDVFYLPEKVFQDFFEKDWQLRAGLALGIPDESPDPRPRMSVDQVTEFFP
jgi:nitroreductase